jgi:hypothetical protein
MSLQEKYLKILSRLIPAGAAAMSLQLGSATLSGANMTGPQPSALGSVRVSEHLRTIREAVSAVGIEIADRPGEVPRTNNRLHKWTKWGNGWGKWGGPH